MKYIKLFEDYTIKKFGKNTPGEFQYCDGVRYKLGKVENTYAISIKDVFHTDGNDYHKDHIDKYKEYIENGGIIETFPVDVIKKASNLEDMFEWFDDSDNFDDYWETLHDTILCPSPDMPALDKALGKREKIPSLYTKPIKYLGEIFDEDEHPEYARINPKATKLEDVFPQDKTPIENELYLLIKKVFDYFDEEKEYHLLDFNHRLWALEELGKKSVLVEEML